MYNNSNKFLYGIDGSGKINISLDNKGIGRLSIGQYVIVETTLGMHTIDLEHRDILLFRSSHTILITENNNFLQIYSTPASNGADITEKPESLESTYSPIK